MRFKKIIYISLLICISIIAYRVWFTFFIFPPRSLVFGDPTLAMLFLTLGMWFGSFFIHHHYLITKIFLNLKNKPNTIQ